MTHRCDVTPAPRHPRRPGAVPVGRLRLPTDDLVEKALARLWAVLEAVAKQGGAESWQ